MTMYCVKVRDLIVEEVESRQKANEVVENRLDGLVRLFGDIGLTPGNLRLKLRPIYTIEVTEDA